MTLNWLRIDDRRSYDTVYYMNSDVRARPLHMLVVKHLEFL